MSSADTPINARESAMRMFNDVREHHNRGLVTEQVELDHSVKGAVDLKGYVLHWP